MINFSACMILPLSRQHRTTDLPRRSAFTLIELIIGITILVLGLTSIFSLALFSINLNQENTRRLQAVELAREGIEAMRNIRDSNWKNNYPFHEGAALWGASFSSPMVLKVSPLREPGGAPWKLETVPAATENNCRLYEMPVEEVALLTHEQVPDGNPSRFSRCLVVQPVELIGNQLQDVSGPGEIVEVTAVVFWQENSGEKKIELSAVLSDWKKL